MTSTSTSDTGLSPSTQYCYTVSALDAEGNESGQSSQACATTPLPSDTVAPTIPTNLSATTVSSSQINLSWSASTDNIGVTGYSIYRDGSLLKSVTSTSTSDTGLSASTQYCYTVSALDAAGNESNTSTVDCQTTNPDAPPTVPTGLSATTVSTSQIDLSWNPSTDDFGVTGYNIYRDGSLLKSVISTSTSDTGLSASTQYCYTVSALDAAGNESGQSTQECATTGTPPDTFAPTPNPMTWFQVPYATSNSAIAMEATTATDPSTPIRYTFDFVDSPTGGSGGTDSALQSSTVYTNSELGVNQQYGYRVRASDGIGNFTNYSSTLYAYTWANMPGYPSSGGPFTNVTETSIRANWTSNGNPPGTEYYCENIDNGTNSGWTTNTFWDSVGLTCGTSYAFRVMARNGDRIVTFWRELDNQYTLGCSDISIMIGDNDGYGYGATIVPDGSILPTSDYDPLHNWIFNNQENSESNATDGSQYTDRERYIPSWPQANFTITIPPVNLVYFNSASLIIDVSGIETNAFGPPSLLLDGNDYSSYVALNQGSRGSNIITISLPYQLLADGKLTVDFQTGNLNGGDTAAIDFFQLLIDYK